MKDKYKKGDYVMCVRDFTAPIVALKKGNIYKVEEFIFSPEGGVNGYTGIIIIEKSEAGERDCFSDNYFVKYDINAYLCI
jgi:hypothetical protein